MAKKPTKNNGSAKEIIETMLFTKSGAEEKITPKIDVKELIKKATRNIGGKYGLFSEACTNSEDYKCENIFITVGGKGKDQRVIILDDGLGMGPDGRESFVSVAKSHSEGDEEKRGRHGLGTKRMMAEFQFCEIVDISADEKDGYMRVMCFDWDIWLNKLIAKEDIIAKRLPRNPKEIGLGPGKTGVRITLWGPRGDRMHTAEQIINNLGASLAPWVVKKVKVSSDGRTWQPLKTRELIGEEIEVYNENHPQLGKVHVRIYIPRSRAESDGLKIGTLGPVCEFSEFRKQLPEYLYKLLRKIWFNPLVCGIIDVSRFNQYRDSTSESFEVSLFESDLMVAFINYIERELADKIEERLGEVQLEKEDLGQKKLLEDVAEICRGIGDEIERGKRVAPLLKAIILEVKDFELLTGEKATIKVRRYPDSTRTIRWDAKNSGGTIDVDSGQQVIFTAGKSIGKFILRCFDKDDPAIESAANISIVPKKQLRIKPEHVTLEIGGSWIFKAINIAEDASGPENLIWSTDDPEGKCRPSRGGKIEYEAGLHPGIFEIICIDRRDRRKKATAIATIVQEKPDRPKREDHESKNFVIDGITYRLFGAKERNSPLLSHKSGEGRGRYVDIRINFEHPALKRAENEGYYSRRQIILRQVMFHHLEIKYTGESITPQFLNEKMSELHLKIAERIIEKEG